jgi:hypothetical protein
MGLIEVSAFCGRNRNQIRFVGTTRRSICCFSTTTISKCGLALATSLGAYVSYDIDLFELNHHSVS